MERRKASLHYERSGLFAIIKFYKFYIVRMIRRMLGMAQSCFEARN